MIKFERISHIFFISAFIVLLTACPQPQQYPPEPQIEFNKVTLSDKTDLLGNPLKNYQLSFKFIDGDGDIGLRPSDTTGVFSADSVFYNNLFLKLYKIKNGKKVIVNDTLTYRTKYIQPIGQNKTLKAEILIDYPFEYKANHKLKYDTVMFEFYMADRQQHLSNVDSTLRLFIDTVGVFYREKPE